MRGGVEATGLSLPGRKSPEKNRLTLRLGGFGGPVSFCA